MDWQPIETAPNDGTHILLWFGPSDAPNAIEGIIQGWWFKSAKQIDDGWETIIGFIGEPTHWMPCPHGPVEGPL